MLKCGECTFLKEHDDGLGSCDHPEKPSAEMIRICDYEVDCQHGYQDIWAARGAARLIAMQKPQKKAATISSGLMNQVGEIVGLDWAYWGGRK